MKEKIILKSTNPDEYEDLVVECRVIENEEIGDYLSTIPEDKKFVAYKSAPVIIRDGIEGETILSQLVTEVDGRLYILSEETGTVKVNDMKNGTKSVDKVVKNINSTSNEEYVVKAQKVEDTYDLIGRTSTGELEYVPSYDPRHVAEVSENVIIKTAWGSKAICLKGGYIVTYDASSNDYNVIEKGAFNSTYKKDTGFKKTL